LKGFDNIVVEKDVNKQNDMLATYIVKNFYDLLTKRTQVSYSKYADSLYLMPLILFDVLLQVSLSPPPPFLFPTQ
jgi:hypothetical protein